MSLTPRNRAVAASTVQAKHNTASGSANPDAAAYGCVVKGVVNRSGKTRVDLESTNLGAFQMGLASTPDDVKRLAKQAAKYWGWKVDGDVIDTEPAAPKPATRKQAPARKAAEVKQPAPAEAEDMAKAKSKKAPAKKAPAKKTAKKAVKKAPARKATTKKAVKRTTKAVKSAAKKVAKATKKVTKKATKKAASKRVTKKVAKKTPAKKAPAKKVTKKAPAKKAPAKKVTKKVTKKVIKKAPAKKPAKKKAAKKQAVAVVSVPSLTGASGAPLVQPELPMIEIERKPAKKKVTKKAATKKAATKKAATKKAAVKKPKKATVKKATAKKSPAKKAPAGKARAGATARAKKPEEKKMAAAKTTAKKPPSKNMQIRKTAERLAKLTSPSTKKPVKASSKTAKVSPGRYSGPGGQKISIKRVWSNPVMNTTSMVIALTATAVGYGVADMLDRWIATRPQDDKKDAKPLYGLPAAKAIRTKPDGTRIAAQLGASAVFGVGAYYTNTKYPYVSFGLGGLAVGAGIKFIELFMKGTLLPAMFKAKKSDEESYSNRYYADLQDWAQQGTEPSALDGIRGARNAGFLGTPPFPGRSPRAHAVGPVATGTVGCGCGSKGMAAYDLSKLFPGSGSFNCSDGDKGCNNGPPGFRMDIPTGNGGGRETGNGGGSETGGGGGGRETGDGGGGRETGDGAGRQAPVRAFTPPAMEQAYQPPPMYPSGTADLMLQFHRGNQREQPR